MARLTMADLTRRTRNLLADVESVERDERALALLRAVAYRVVAEYDKTMLTHDVNYEDVASEIDQLRLVLAWRPHPGLRPEYAALIEQAKGAEPGTGSGTETRCPIEGVHEHPFRGPHRFREWYEGEQAKGAER